MLPFSATAGAKVDRVHWYIKDNAKNHNTIKYDLVHDNSEPRPVLRRGLTFYLAIRFQSDYDVTRDRVILNFKFGKCWIMNAVFIILTCKSHGQSHSV